MMETSTFKEWNIKCFTVSTQNLTFNNLRKQEQKTKQKKRKQKKNNIYKAGGKNNTNLLNNHASNLSSTELSYKIKA